MKKHIWYYAVLLFIFFISAYFITTFSYDRRLQMTWIVLLGFLYALAGIIHHIVDHTITGKIVIEYILIATLGITVMLFIFQSIL